MRLSNAQRQLSIVQAQMKGYTREAKLQALTAEQLSGFGCDTRVYKAVGKMFMEENFDDAVADANQKKAEALESYAMLEKKSKVRRASHASFTKRRSPRRRAT